MNNEFARYMVNLDRNRTKGVIDAIVAVGSGTKLGRSPQEETGSIETLVDIIGDLLARKGEYADKYLEEEGRFGGYHHTLVLLESLCHLTGRE